LKAIWAHASWPSALKNCAAGPLIKLQSDILRLLAMHRDPESYVADSAWLTQHGPRYSGDIDIFRDREDRVARAGQKDEAVLKDAGLTVECRRREPAFFQAIVSRAGREICDADADG
jgi:hypothetical protein